MCIFNGFGYCETDIDAVVGLNECWTKPQCVCNISSDEKATTAALAKIMVQVRLAIKYINNLNLKSTASCSIYCRRSSITQLHRSGIASRFQLRPRTEKMKKLKAIWPFLVGCCLSENFILNKNRCNALMRQYSKQCCVLRCRCVSVLWGAWCSQIWTFEKSYLKNPNAT